MIWPVWWWLPSPKPGSNNHGFTVMIRFRHHLLLGVLAALPLQSQDVDTQYLRLQEAYSQRLQDLEQRHQRQQRELLNKFILALVRTEQGYREEGDLEGVVVSRELRETLLQTPEAAAPDPSWPERVLEMARELETRQTQNREQSQAELDELNRVLLRTLEPYKVEFTRQGNLQQAIEVRNLQEQLALSLGIELETPVRSRPAGPALVNTDPSAYAFYLEPDVFQNRTGIQPRNAMVELQPEVRDKVESTSRGYRFQGGSLFFPAEQMEPLRETANRSQLLMLELGLTTTWSFQGNRQTPAALFHWGERREDPNLAVTQEGQNLFLYLKTTTPPPGMPVHRIDLGQVTPNEPLHVMAVFRANETIIYRDGVATQRLRGSVLGSLSAWEEAAAVMGRADLPSVGQGQEPTRWYGEIHQLCIRAGQETSRQVANHYERFLNALQQ